MPRISAIDVNGTNTGVENGSTKSNRTPGIIEGGSWQISGSINADGQVIAAATNAQTFVSISNFRFGTVGGYAGPTPTLTLKDAGSSGVSKYLRLINVDGIGATNIDMTTATGGPQYRYVEMVNQGTPGALTNINFRQILAAGESLDTTQTDVTKLRATSGTVTTLSSTTATLATINHGVASPAQITASQNDYNGGAAKTWRLSTDASRNITGFTGGVAGMERVIINVGTQPIVLVHGSASSAAGNRLYTNAAGSSITCRGAGFS